MKVVTLSILLLCSLMNVSAKVTCKDDDILIPNPEDCGSFYSCGNGVPILTVCPPNLQFNPEILVCDRPENVNCQVTPEPTKTTSKPTTPEQTETTPEPTQTTQGPTETTPEPTQTTQEPTETTQEPTETTQQPTETTQQPTETTQQPTETTQQPTETTQQPTETTQEPTETTQQPTETTQEPTETTPEPTETTPEPTETTTRQPTTTTTRRPTRPTTTRRPTTTTRRPTRPTTTRRPTTTTTRWPTRPTSTTRPTTTTQSSTVTEGTTTQGPTNGTTTEEITTLSPGNDTTTEGVTTETPTNGTTTDESTTTEGISTTSTEGTTTQNPSNETTTEDITTQGPNNGTTTEEVSTEAPNNGTTTEEVSTEAPNNGTTTEEISTEAPNNGTTTEQPSNSTTTEEPEYKPDCPEDGYAILENPESCSSFYVCINGVSGLVQCPDGLEINLETLKCDLPENAQCRLGTTTTPAPYVPPCPENGTVQLPDPSSCSSFYICINGNYAQLSCPDDFEYNATSQSCVHPDQSTCGAVFRDIDYSFECEEDGSFPDPDDCTKYYVCVNNQVIPMECPGGLHFDSSLKTCNNPEEAQCEVTTTSKPTTTTTQATTTTTQATTTTTQAATTTTQAATTTTTQKPSDSTTTKKPVDPQCPEEGSAVLPNPENCSQFIICIEGSFDVVDCPEGYSFDAEKGNCALSENVNCNAVTHPDCPSEGSAKLPNPEDCGSYLFCINGKSAVIECPEGLNYDADEEVCSASATCSTDTSSTKPSETTSTTTQKPTTSSTTSTTQKPTTTEEQTTTSKPTVKPNDCANDDGKPFPNPQDCSSFLQCDNGIPVRIDCPAGLEFNADLLVCDTPASANCSESKKKSLFSFLKFWN